VDKTLERMENIDQMNEGSGRHEINMSKQISDNEMEM
jgi:hypothetical protein